MNAAHFIFINAVLSITATSFAQPFWQRQADLHSLAPPVSLAAVNDQVAWLCDFNGQVWHTDDAGRTWRLTGTVTREEKICLKNGLWPQTTEKLPAQAQQNTSILKKVLTYSRPHFSTISIWRWITTPKRQQPQIFFWLWLVRLSP